MFNFHFYFKSNLKWRWEFVRQWPVLNTTIGWHLFHLGFICIYQVNISIYQVDTYSFPSARWMFSSDHFISSLMPFFPPSRTCCFSHWHFPACMHPLAQAWTISTFLLQVPCYLVWDLPCLLPCLVPSLLFPVSSFLPTFTSVFFLQPPFSSSFSLRVWRTNNSGSSRRRSTLC